MDPIRQVTHRQGGATPGRVIRVWGRGNLCRNRCFDHQDLFARGPHNYFTEYSVYLNLYVPFFYMRSLGFTNQTNQSLEYLSNGSWYDWYGGSFVQERLLTAQYTNGYYNEEESE